MWELGNVMRTWQSLAHWPPPESMCPCVQRSSAVALRHTLAGLHFPADWKQSHCWFSPKRSIWKCNCLELHGGSERPDLSVNNFLLSWMHWALLSTVFSLEIISVEGRGFGYFSFMLCLLLSGGDSPFPSFSVLAKWCDYGGQGSSPFTVKFLSVFIAQGCIRTDVHLPVNVPLLLGCVTWCFVSQYHASGQ